MMAIGCAAPQLAAARAARARRSPASPRRPSVGRARAGPGSPSLGPPPRAAAAMCVHRPPPLDTHSQVGRAADDLQWLLHRVQRLPLHLARTGGRCRLHDRGPAAVCMRGAAPCTLHDKGASLRMHTAAGPRARRVRRARRGAARMHPVWPRSPRLGAAESLQPTTISLSPPQLRHISAMYFSLEGTSAVEFQGRCADAPTRRTSQPRPPSCAAGGARAWAGAPVVPAAGGATAGRRWVRARAPPPGQRSLWANRPAAALWQMRGCLPLTAAT